MAGGTYRETLSRPGMQPFLWAQFLGAFNDNVFRQAIVGLLGVMAAAGMLDESTRGTYTQLAPAVSDFLGNANRRDSAGLAGRKMVEENRGALTANMRLIEQLIK